MNSNSIVYIKNIGSYLSLIKELHGELDYISVQNIIDFNILRRNSNDKFRDKKDV